MDNLGELKRRTSDCESSSPSSRLPIRARSSGRPSLNGCVPKGCRRPRSSAVSGGLTSWNDHLNPHISKQNWSREDTLRLLHLQHVHNSKWSLIAAEFNQRSPTFLKNTFFLTLRKVLRKLAKLSHQVVSAGELKTLQSRVLTEFLWSDLDPSAINSHAEVPSLRMVDMFKMVIRGDLDEVQRTFKGMTRPLVEAMFARLQWMK